MTVRRVAPVALVAMPWAHFAMPSIQLGTLSAWLRNSGAACDSFHWYLPLATFLGRDAYSHFWYPYLEDGEALYAYLLFPEQRERILADAHLAEKFRELTNASPLFSQGLSTAFFDEFARFHEDLFDSYDWSDCELLGFTLNFGQTVSSLYAAKQIRRRNPAIKVVFGGAEASGELGSSLLQNFAFIDFACAGEGEQLLVNLWRSIESGGDPSSIPGLTYRSPSGIVSSKAAQVQFASLPTPDYTEYFEYPDARGSCEAIPIESSRGCIYKCTFCALNALWDGFRDAPVAHVVNQIDQLLERWGLTSFFFVDNITPRNVEQLAEAIAARGSAIEFFYEVRAGLPYRTIQSMVNAGLTRVQIGIESFSEGLLLVFNKKASVLHNLQAMKNYTALGVPYTANLITDHPRATESHIEETLHNMQFARAFPPPDACCPFAMEVGSPDSHSSGDVTISGNYRRYERIYPPELFSSLDLPRKEFTTQLDGADWGPVVEAHRQWVEHYKRLACENKRAALRYQHVGEKIEIIDERFEKPRRYSYSGLAALMLLPHESWRIQTFAESHCDGDSETVLSLISELERRFLIFRRRDVVLSLPVQDVSFA